MRICMRATRGRRARILAEPARRVNAFARGPDARGRCARVRVPVQTTHRTRPRGAAFMDALTRHLDEHRDRYLEDLKAALRIPSVSAKAEHQPDMQRCAEHLVTHLKSIG